MLRLDLGVGLVVFPDLLPLLDDLDDLVDVYEVEPQTYWLPTGDPIAPWRMDAAAFRSIAARGRPVLAHGVSAPVGGASLPDPRAVELFARSVEVLGALGASEHLATNHAVVDGETVETGVFLPPCPSWAGVDAAVAAVHAYQRALEVPFSIETAVNYLRPRPGDLTDAEVVAAVAERSGCGIVLDLHNLWCNARNGREPVADALARLPLDRVTEVHVAGGFELDGYYLDAHSGATPDPVLAIAADVLPRLPACRAVTFEILPAFLWRVGLAPLRHHLGELRELVVAARRSSPQPGLAAVPQRLISSGYGDDPATWERRLAGALAGADVPDDPGIGILRRLVDSGRRGRLTMAARTTVRLLLVAAPDAVDALLDEYCRTTMPRLWSHDEGAAFLDWFERGRTAGPGWRCPGSPTRSRSTGR